MYPSQQNIGRKKMAEEHAICFSDKRPCSLKKLHKRPNMYREVRPKRETEACISFLSTYLPLF